MQSEPEPWNQCSRSMTFWCGSGSGSILLFSSLTFKMPEKKLIFNTTFSACYFLKVHIHYFSKIKSQKVSQNSRTQYFSYYFCMIEGSGYGSKPLTSGSGSGRPKNTRIRWILIRIRIRNTAWNRNFLPCGTGTVTFKKVGTGTVINYGYVITVLKWYHKSSHKHTVKNCIFHFRHLLFFHSHFTIN